MGLGQAFEAKLMEFVKMLRYTHKQHRFCFFRSLLPSSGVTQSRNMRIDRRLSHASYGISLHSAGVIFRPDDKGDIAVDMRNHGGVVHTL